MTRKERLLRTLRGEGVDRPPVCFYEINGLDENPDDPDPFNIFSHPSWRPLIELARERTDRIVMRGVAFQGVLPDPVAGVSETETFLRGGSLHKVHRVRIGNRTLTARTRRDPDVNTEWTEEHLLKDEADLEAFLELPPPDAGGAPDPAPVRAAEAALGETGLVMVDTPDPLCMAALLFDMADYTVIAMTRPDLFNRLLDRFAAVLLPRTEAAAAALPGRLWRIYGPEFAAPPYLPPSFYGDYVGRFVGPMVRDIQRHGGFARIHSHGRLRDILDQIAALGPDGLDPIEPPPQGDVTLRHVRERHGRDMVLFGNIELSDIETLPGERFAEKVRRALDEGTAGAGRGFVLMPSACPIGRELSAVAMKNYEVMVRLAEGG